MFTLQLVVMSLGAMGVLVGSYCYSSYGAASSLSSFGPFSSSSTGDLVLSPMVGREHPPLYLSGTSGASQETAISGSCQQALVSIHNSPLTHFTYHSLPPSRSLPPTILPLPLPLSSEQVGIPLDSFPPTPPTPTPWQVNFLQG
jgi:hypothetical protein